MRATIFFPLVLTFFFVLLTEISIAQDGTVKGKISNGIEILPGATISLGNNTILSNENGEFTLSVKPGKFTLTVGYAGYAKIEKKITVTAGGIQIFDFVLQPSDQMENVIVLGSRKQTQRSNLSTPVPIDVIQISKLPQRQVELTRIIENTIPSFFAAPHGFREGKQTAPASLRGSGPDHILVLLNGRRLHTTASPWTFGVIGFGTVGVDLNAIPSAAIETVEVLRDGASAQYGSDAVAGVINLQLKKLTGITSVQLNTGQYYKGDGESISLSVNHGFEFLKKGFLNLTAQTRFNNYTQRNGEYKGYVYNNCPGCSAVDSLRIRAIDDSIIKARGFDLKNHRPLGDNRVLNSGFSMNGGYTVNKSTSIFWTAAWNYRFSKDRASNVYRYPKDSLRINTKIYPDGFLPGVESTMPDVSVIGGLEGITNSGWKWDAGIIYGKNSSRMDVINSNNASQQYTYEAEAPKHFYTGKQVFLQITNNINFRRDLSKFVRAIKSLTIAAGPEFRIERYHIYQGEEASWQNYAPVMRKEGGSQGQSGFQPANAVDKSRQVIGAYTEIEMEKDDRLLLSMAGRYEYYSDFGNNIAGKFAIRYRFSDHVMWRGSFSNGFRAPALQQRYYSLITSQSRPGGVLVRTGTFRNDDPIAVLIGISSLKAERAINLSSGFTSTLSKNLSITADAYWVQIRNRIIYSGNIPADGSFPEVRTILNNAGLTDVQSLRFFSNAINTRTKGLDIVLSGHWLINKSKLQTLLAVNFNQTSLYGAVQYAKNLPDNDKYRNLLVNREERCRVETAYPKNKIILNLNYTIGKWELSAAFTRYGKIIQRGNDTVRNVYPTTYLDETFSPKMVSALNINCKILSWLSVTLGVENIFDIYPDKLKYYDNTVNGTLIYNPNFAPFGVNGGYYYLSMAFNW